jgi:hypothetical protein
MAVILKKTQRRADPCGHVGMGREGQIVAAPARQGLENRMNSSTIAFAQIAVEEPFS